MKLTNSFMVSIRGISSTECWTHFQTHNGADLDPQSTTPTRICRCKVTTLRLQKTGDPTVSTESSFESNHRQAHLYTKRCSCHWSWSQSYGTQSNAWRPNLWRRPYYAYLTNQDMPLLLEAWCALLHLMLEYASTLSRWTIQLSTTRTLHFWQKANCKMMVHSIIQGIKGQQDKVYNGPWDILLNES